MPQEQNNQPDNQKSLYLLCEEYEDGDGIREFSVLAASLDKPGLQLLLRAKVEKDEYGYFAENGINDEGDTYCSSNFEAGFVSYYIREEAILDRDAITHLLNTKEYDTTFHHPENLPEILKMTIHSFAAGEGYPDVDPEPVMTALLRDKVFQSLVKNAYWGDKPFVDHNSIPRAVDHINAYLKDQFRDDPDYFATTGGIARCCYPENFESIVLDTIYQVARENHLPITSLETDVNKIMRNPLVRAFCLENQTDWLLEGSAVHEKATALCYRVTSDYYRLPKENNIHPPLSTKVKNAQLRITQQGREAYIPFPENEMSDQR